MRFVTAKYYESPVGRLTIAADERGLRGLWMENQRFYAQGYTLRFGMENAAITLAERWLDAYFAGEKPVARELPLFPEGSDFRQQVWKCLTEIPYGQVVTYGGLAEKIAEQNGLPSMSAQAVGGAVGHNPISILIPCHRVVGKNGNLTGYAGGLERKTALLRLEGIDAGNVPMVKKT